MHALPALLDELESYYGKQKPDWPTDPYQFLVWWHCGYPPSEAACAKGWQALSREIGTSPEQLLAASPASLERALKSGGTFPDLRAMRLKAIAARVKDEFEGDLRSAIAGPQARRILRGFPNMADPGIDRILLFSGLSPVAAIPSNCPHVLVRIQSGKESANYGANYRQAQGLIESGVPATTAARTRAYLLLKRHGQELCKRSKPRCEVCPVRPRCAYF